MTRFPRLTLVIAQLLAFVIVHSTLAIPCQGQRVKRGQPIIISFGQPNIWSLEQAHYLLARLRSQSLLLQGKELAQGDLDPNEVNGTRIDLLKTMLGVSVGFSQAAGFQNQQATKEATFTQDRRHRLLGLRDQRQAELHSIDEQLANLRVERERMNSDNSVTDAAKQVKTVEIEQMVARQSRVGNDISNLTSDINGLPAVGTTLATPTPASPTASPLADSVVDKLLATEEFKQELNKSPKLNASTKLDNYLNLQYEIIAKQMTLLRDEVGPGQRLVFLELPHSFYTVPDKANRKMAQVWWRVTKYYERTKTGEEKRPPRCEDEEKNNVRQPTPRALENRFKCNPYGSDRPRSENTIFSEIKAEGTVKRNRATAMSQVADAEKDKEWYEYDATESIRALDLIPRQSALNVNDIQDRQKNFNIMGLFTWLSGLGASVSYQREQRLYQQFLQQEVYASAFGKGQSDFGWTFGPRPGSERIAPGLQNTYAVLVLPESAEAITINATGCYFPRSDYAPNTFADTKETDADSMAAGSDRLQCTAHEKKFDLVIPSTTNNNFWITGINYRPVKPGERATVYLHGDYFSPQIGVLVKNVALRHSIGLAQSELALPRKDTTFEPAPIGDFEFVNSKLLVLSFSIPNFKGNPTIALVTPGRARVINNLRLVINDSYKCRAVKLPNCPQAVSSAGVPVTDDGKRVPVTYKKAAVDEDTPERDSIWVRLDDQVPALFSEDTPFQVLALNTLRVFEPIGGEPTFRALLTGSKFGVDDQIRVNGLPITKACYDRRGRQLDCSGEAHREQCMVGGLEVKCPRLLAPGLFEIEFPATNESTLEITVIHPEKNPNDTVYTSKPFANPFVLRVDRVNVLGYQPAGKLRVLRIQLEGVGFNARIRADASPDAGVVSQTNSPTVMVLDLKIRTANRFITIILHDPHIGISIPVVVTRPEEETPAEADEEEEGTSSNKKTRRSKG
jgi:hypothetical protein